jgi:5-methylcytosine-specific restriction endonuclease McrA
MFRFLRSLFRPRLTWYQFVQTDAFLRHWKWRRVRYEVLFRSDGRCCLCGRSKRGHSVTLNVDHVKSRKTHPHLALDPKNLQVLCADCNIGKGNKPDDWRSPAQIAQAGHSGFRPPQPWLRR